LRPYWKLAAMSAALIVLGALVGLLVPWPLKLLFDNVLGDRPLPPALAWLLGPLAGDRSRLLLVAVLAGLGLVIFQNALSVLDNYVNTKLDQNMVLDFRSDLFRHAQRLSLTHHDQRRSGMLIYAINFQADAVARLVLAIPPLAQSALTLVGMFWIALWIDFQLALLSLFVVPVLFYSVRYYVKHIQRHLEDVRALEGESLSIVHEAVSMLKVIVAFGREDYEHNRFRRQGEKTVAARVNVTVRQTLFSLVVNTTTAIGTALVLGCGAAHVLDGRLTGGLLLVMMAYVAGIYKPLEAISTTIGSLQDVLVSLRTAFGVLDTEPGIRDLPGAVSVPRAQGHVTFENVEFSYTGRVDTLKNISFEARPGQVVAIVGPTGAGKSTLVSLIPRFHEAGKGRILLDGVDTRDMMLRSLRRHVSIVHQEPLLFSGTVYDNIRYGRLEATREEIIEAARAANAHDFILRLPKQYDTELGERGAQLSGGERQRIAVARAFLKDSPILILDEPTSAIDSKTEAVMLDALERLMAGRTTFLIAHRLSTIRKADLILVLDRGHLVEKGTHDDLLHQGGLYKQLYDIQTRQTRRKLLQESAAEPTGDSRLVPTLQSAGLISSGVPG
jgi:ATP-binding cassette subfamily B protein/subfamily B ATP-binding cassette protein MsbA